jgi:hypothetical protein
MIMVIAAKDIMDIAIILPQKFNACQTLLAKFTSHVTWKVYNQTLP